MRICKGLDYPYKLILNCVTCGKSAPNFIPIKNNGPEYIQNLYIKLQNLYRIYTILQKKITKIYNKNKNIQKTYIKIWKISIY